MRKRLLVPMLLVSLFALLSSVAGAQGVAWVRQVGTWSDDFAYDVAVDSTGNVYLAGSVEGAQEGTGDRLQQDAFLAKFDAAGNELWRRYLQTDTVDVAHGVTVDGQNNVYVVGTSAGTLPGQDAFSGAFVAKYDAAGNQLWLRQFASDGWYDEARAVAVAPDGAVVVAGLTNGALPGNTSKGGDDAFLVKFNASGDQVWAVQFGTEGNDQANGVDTDGAGNIYLAGSFGGSILGNLTDASVAKFSPAGALVWQRFYAPADLNNYGHDVVADAAGNSYLAAGVEATDVGGAYALVRKYDTNGSEVWTDKFGTPANPGRNDEATGIDLDAAGDIYVGGTIAAGVLPGQTEDLDLFVRKYQPQGGVVWTQQFGPPFLSSANALAVGPGGAVYVAGRNDLAFPGHPEPKGSDAFLVRLAGSGGAATERVYLPLIMR